MKHLKRILLIIMCVLSLTGVRAQTISAKEKAQIKQMYINFCKEVNQQLPVQVDEITTLKSMLFTNWTLTAYYAVDIAPEEFTSEEMSDIEAVQRELFKERAREMFTSGSYTITRSEFRTLMKVTGLRFRAMYYDVYDNFMLSVLLDYKDF